MTTIHFPLAGARETKKGRKEFDMATLKIQQKVWTQRGGAGRIATEPQVRISENGQLSFNKLALVGVQGFEYALWLDSRDEGPKRKETTCQVKCFKTPEKWPIKIKNVGEFTEQQVAKLNWSQVVNDNPTACNVTISGDLKALGYDFKASGAQKFKAEVDAEAHTVTFTVPVGALAPLPKQARTPRKQKAKETVNNAAKEEVKKATEELTLE